MNCILNYILNYQNLDPVITEIPGIISTEHISEGILKIKSATNNSGGDYKCTLSYKWNNTFQNITRNNKITFTAQINSAKTVNFSDKSIATLIFFFYIFLHIIANKLIFLI